MKLLEANPYRNCDFGDIRLTNRAVLIAEDLKVKYGQPLSQIFKSASDLKRGYEFFSNPKATFNKLTQPSFKQAESYRLAGESMSTMLGFLTVIAAQLLRMTYLHRNSPHSSAELVLTKLQMDVLLTSTPAKQKKSVELTVDWAIRAIARLGGYLEHRKNSPIGIQVLWRGWLRLETLCQGWLLHQNLKSLY
jgi:hypothetical protein